MRSTVAFVLLLFIPTMVMAQEHNHMAPKKKPKSPPDSTSITVAGVNLELNYSRPSTRGRIIWGGLVPYDEVWVTGAHRANKLTIDQDVEIDGTALSKGSYAVFTIPGKEKWTVIINKNWDQHLADDYDPALDILRVEVPHVDLNEKVEMLQFEFQSDESNSVKLVFGWDMLGFELPIQLMESSK